jgi:hypothetical protein
MKNATLILFGLIGAGVLYQVIERVPPEALTVALGVTCGLAASLPVALGLLIALTRNRQQADPVEEWVDTEPTPVRYLPPAPQRIPQQTQEQQPQIIVIAPPQGQFGPGQLSQQLPQMPFTWNNAQYPFIVDSNQGMQERDWRIIGEE